MVVTSGQQYHVGEKPTVILHTYINRHAGTPDKKQKQNRNNVVQLYSILVYILLFTQAPIPVCLDGTIIDSRTILVTNMYYCGYVGV